MPDLQDSPIFVPLFLFLPLSKGLSRFVVLVDSYQNCRLFSTSKPVNCANNVLDLSLQEIIPPVFLGFTK